MQHKEQSSGTVCLSGNVTPQREVRAFVVHGSFHSPHTPSLMQLLHPVGLKDRQGCVDPCSLRYRVGQGGGNAARMELQTWEGEKGWVEICVKTGRAGSAEVKLGAGQGWEQHSAGYSCEYQVRGGEQGTPVVGAAQCKTIATVK